MYCLLEVIFKYEDLYRLKVQGQKKIIYIYIIKEVEVIVNFKYICFQGKENYLIL